MNFKDEKTIIFIIFTILIFGIISFIDRALAAGIIFIIFLYLITFYFFKKIKIEDGFLLRLFSIVLFIHFAAVLFVYYAHFNPFSGGLSDAMEYQPQAEEIAKAVRQGNIFLKGVNVHLYHTIAVGYVYAFTVPDMLLGQLFNAWIVALSAVFAYLIVLEIGETKKWAFLTGLIVALYPSYVFYGSLLLKDSFVVLFASAGLLFLLKLLKKFTRWKFLIFYLASGLLVNTRFYTGYILIFTFIICWFLLFKVPLKEKIIKGIFFIFLLGFLPQIFSTHGYYGINDFKRFINPETITFYREVAFVPQAPPSSQPSSSLEKPSTPPTPSTPSTPSTPPTPSTPSTPSIPSTISTPPTPPSSVGMDSTIVIKTEFDKPLKFIFNYIKSFTYAVLGPFPWQIKHIRQLFALAETIPFYILFFFIIRGMKVSLKQNRNAIPLIIFSLGVFGVIALYFTNFGQVMRIRMPAIISLLSLVPLGVRDFQGRIRNLRDKNEKIKVCQVSVNSASIKFLALNQIKFLQKEGYDLSAVCSGGKWTEDIEKENIKVKIIQFKRKIFTPFSDFMALIKLFFYFRKEKFDIVHTHTPKAGFLGQIAAKAAGIPVVIHTNHGFYFQKTDPWLKKEFFILIEKIAAKCSDLIFSVNKEDIETAITEKICPASQIKYLGGWVDLERFNPYKFPENFIVQKKKQFDINLDSKVIGIVARLVKEKGYLDLFEAFKEVRKKFPETLLLIIGAEEPEKKDRINMEIIKNYNNIEKNVIFLGERIDVDEIFILMDVFVLPSYREGMGLSILEASAMEKAVVVTDIRGCREAVDNEKTGILVPVNDSEKLAKAIIYLLSNPEKRKEMGRRGRIKIINEFSEKIIFERIKKEYQRLVKEKII